MGNPKLGQPKKLSRKTNKYSRIEWVCMVPRKVKKQSVRYKLPLSAYRKIWKHDYKLLIGYVSLSLMTKYPMRQCFIA